MASTKNAKRVDPSPRYLGQPPIFTLQNADPNRKYVWVNQATPAEGPGREAYEIDGYEVEVYRTGGVAPRGIRTLKDGDEIVVRGMWLMSIAKDAHQALVAEGQARADARERQILQKKGLLDPMRGQQRLNNRYVSLSSGISELRQEFGGVGDG